eukprot:6213981-Pyramimonas_sp.AAC.1
MVAVTIDGKHAPGSPFRVEARLQSTSLAASQLYGPGLRTCVAGKRASFMIEVRVLASAPPPLCPARTTLCAVAPLFNLQRKDRRRSDEKRFALGTTPGAQPEHPAFSAPSGADRALLSSDCASCLFRLTRLAARFRS